MRFLLLGSHRDENLHDSCDNHDAGGAGARPNGTGQGWWQWWQARPKKHEQTVTEQQQKKNEENAYKDALKKIPDQPVKQKDPWGNMR